LAVPRALRDTGSRPTPTPYCPVSDIELQ
jgi:hypothetical protein